jgi:ADP-ribosyltransferase exoenzyme
MKIWSNALQQLTPKQRYAICNYGNGLSNWDINMALRRFPIGFDGSVRRAVDQIDAALRLQPTVEDVIVNRSVTEAAFPFGAPNAVDYVLRDPAFTSASLMDPAPMLSSRRVMLHLRVPAGLPGLYIAPLTDFEHNHEIILARGLRYEFFDLAHKNGIWHLMGEVLRPVWL